MNVDRSRYIGLDVAQLATSSNYVPQIQPNRPARIVDIVRPLESEFEARLDGLERDNSVMREKVLPIDRNSGSLAVLVVGSCRLRNACLSVSICACGQMRYVRAPITLFGGHP